MDTLFYPQNYQFITPLVQEMEREFFAHHVGSRELISARRLFPCCFGSGLKLEGVDVLLDILDTPVSPELLPPKEGDSVWASAVFPATLPLPLVARCREAGDTILSHGMTKRIKKILNEKDIPLHLRDRIPLICLADGEPLWFPRAAFRDGFPAPTHGACIRITVYLRG